MGKKIKWDYENQLSVPFVIIAITHSFQQSTFQINKDIEHW
jgi:hypothetical protein